jgi:hypothetical protein
MIVEGDRDPGIQIPEEANTAGREEVMHKAEVRCHGREAQETCHVSESIYPRWVRFHCAAKRREPATRRARQMSQDPRREAGKRGSAGWEVRSAFVDRAVAIVALDAPLTRSEREHRELVPVPHKLGELRVEVWLIKTRVMLGHDVDAHGVSRFKRVC